MGSLGTGPAQHQVRFLLTTRSSRVSIWSVSRRISTSPLWVSLEVGRLLGSFCCCSMISRPWWGRAAQAQLVSGVSSHQEPKCPLSSLEAPLLWSSSMPALSLPPYFCFCHPLHLESPPPSVLPLHSPLIHPPTQALPPPGSLLELHLYPQVNSASDCTPPSVVGRLPALECQLGH